MIGVPVLSSFIWLILLLLGGDGGGICFTGAFVLVPTQTKSIRQDLPLHPVFASTTTTTPTTSIEDLMLDEQLWEIAQRLKLEVFDIDDGVFGFESKDLKYGIEVIRTTITLNPTDASLGLNLVELARSDNANDNRGLVLISDVSGPAAQATPSPIQVGDVITGVMVLANYGDHDEEIHQHHHQHHNHDYLYRERTTGLNYDRTVEVIAEAKTTATTTTNPKLTLELNRLVPRAEIHVVVEHEGSDSGGDRASGTTTTTTIEALAGENLRRLLLRKGITLYNRHTKRFDMPFSTGDCAGEGLCGTCLVQVQEGMHLLNDKSPHEELITQRRPLSWRASCRTVVGAQNQPGTLRISVQPQTHFHDEQNPGVQSLEP